MSKKLKIAWITYFPHPVYQSLINTLCNKYKHIDITIIISDHLKGRLDGNKLTPNNKVKRFNIRFSKIAHKLVAGRRINYYQNLEEVLMKIEPDIVISNLFYDWRSFQAFRFAKKHGVDFFLSVQTKPKKSYVKRLAHSLWNITFGKMMLKYAKKIIPWTQDSKVYIQRIANNKDKIQRHSAGIDTDTFYPAEHREYKHYEKLKVLMVARMVPYKEHGTLLKALHRLKSRNELPGIQLDLLGEGPLKAKVKKEVQRLGLNNHVKFLDKVPYSEMKNLYQSHDFLVLPSDGEAIGMVVPEAMACGTPVIVSDTVGAKDYVVDGENGLIFKTGDDQDLAEKLMKISVMDLEQMGKHAAGHIRKKNEISKMADRFFELIK